MRGVQAALMLAQEAAEDLEDVAEAAYTPSEGGYAQVRLPARGLAHMHTARDALSRQQNVEGWRACGTT
jgi:hypothetical protein